MRSSLHGVVDIDFVKYTAASVGQKNTISITHKATGETILNPITGKPFNTRTEFYGRNKARNQGWLGQDNLLRESPRTWEEFDIEDVITPEPLENVLHTVKMMIDSAIKQSGVKTWTGYIGKGVSFRENLSTLWKYKDRSAPKPYHFDSVVHYIEEKYKPELVEHLEVDDVLVMEAYNKPNVIVIGEDKDYRTSPVKFFDVNRVDEGIIDCRGFGEIWLKNNDTTLSGKGRLFKYGQILTGDSVDTYKANCMSEVKWGDKSAYKVLQGVTDDKTAWQVIVDTYKMLYPEPKKVTGWRGDQIEIDWLYVLQEIVNLSHLHRWKDDFINVKNVLNKLEIKI